MVWKKCELENTMQILLGLKGCNDSIWLILSICELTSESSRVEGFSTFLIFENQHIWADHFYFLETHFQKTALFCRCAQQSFHFQKITGTLKFYILFENLQRPSLWSLNYEVCERIKEKSTEIFTRHLLKPPFTVDAQCTRMQCRDPKITPP